MNVILIEAFLALSLLFSPVPYTFLFTMTLQRATAANFFESDSDSDNNTNAYDNGAEEEFSVAARVVEEEEVNSYEEAQARGYKDLLFGEDEEDEEEEEEEEDDEEEQADDEEEEEEEFFDSETGEEEEEEEDEEFYDSESGEDEGDSLASDDLSSCSDMSIDMEEYAGIDGVAVVAGEQVGGSGCGWYPRVYEDIEMEEVPCLNVEMVDANGGVDVDMEEVEQEDVEMEEVFDLMDADEEFW